MDVAAHDFVLKHKAWYDDTRKGFQPIIGGMSGHTLGYLNLYIAALNKFGRANKRAVPPDAPTLERFRAVMLAGLIGNKRHHSYTEVMSASHGFQFIWKSGKGEEQLAHNSRSSYHDLWTSNDQLIQRLTTDAMQQTAFDIVTFTPPNSVLNLVDQWAQKNGKDTKKLREDLIAYLRTNIKDPGNGGAKASLAVANVKAEVEYVLSSSSKH